MNSLTRLTSHGQLIIRRSLTLQSTLLTNKHPYVSTEHDHIYSSPFPDVPVGKQSLHKQLFQSIDRVINNNPKQIAFISAEDETDRITFMELKRRAEATSVYLSSIGFKKGDVAGLALPNGPNFVIALLGILGCGGIVTAPNPFASSQDFQSRLQDVDAKVVFVDEMFMDKVVEACRDVKSLKKVIGITTSILPSEVIDFRKVMETRGKAPKVDVKVEDTVVIPYSSGTSGRPKGIILSNRATTTMINIMTDYFTFNSGAHFFTSSELKAPLPFMSKHLVCQLAMFHIYGFMSALTNICLGSTNIYLKNFDPKLYLKVIDQYKVPLLLVVPPMLQLMKKHASEYHMDSVKVIISGAASCSKDLVDDITKKRPDIKFSQAYGLTEVSMACALPDFRRKVDLSASGYPIATTQFKIVDNNGNKLAPNQNGVICIRSPIVMDGYMDNEKETAEKLKDGWLHTEDVGYVNEDGMVFVVARQKDIINVNGVQVAPGELEDVLSTHPKVQDVAVLGVPHKTTGETPIAFVVRNKDSLTQQELLNFVADHLPQSKQLTEVQFISEIPKLPSGKIMRRLLRDQYQQQQQQDKQQQQ